MTTQPRQSADAVAEAARLSELRRRVEEDAAAATVPWSWFVLGLSLGVPIVSVICHLLVVIGGAL